MPPARRIVSPALTDLSVSRAVSVFLGPTVPEVIVALVPSQLSLPLTGSPYHVLAGAVASGTSGTLPSNPVHGKVTPPNGTGVLPPPPPVPPSPPPPSWPPALLLLQP